MDGLRFRVWWLIYSDLNQSDNIIIRPASVRCAWPVIYILQFVSEVWASFIPFSSLREIRITSSCRVFGLHVFVVFYPSIPRYLSFYYVHSIPLSFWRHNWPACILLNGKCYVVSLQAVTPYSCDRWMQAIKQKHGSCATRYNWDAKKGSIYRIDTGFSILLFHILVHPSGVCQGHAREFSSV